MKFRIIPSILAIALSLVIGLVLGIVSGIGKDDGLRVQVEGNFAAPVTLAVSGSINPARQQTILIQGEGKLLEDNMQVLFRVSNFAYTKTGYLSTINNAILKAGSITQEELGDLYPLMKGKAEGSRIMAIFPNESKANAEIVVLDILPTINAGEHQALTTMPAAIAVTADEQGVPSVSADGSKISETKVGVLVAGEGEQILEGDQLYANYLIVKADGTLVESTYANPEPVFLDMNKIFSGLAQALVDQRVGSRIVAAIPQVEARGDGDLVIVVDILARAEDSSVTKAEKKTPEKNTPEKKTPSGSTTDNTSDTTQTDDTANQTEDNS